MDFKDIFIQLRKERKYTQEGIAKALNVSKSTIAMWETGERKPSTDKYEEVSDFFNVDMDFLYGKTNIKRKTTFDNNGNKSEVPIYDKDTIELIDLFSKINKEQKQTVLAMLRSFAN